MGNNSPLPLSPTHKCHREASNSESVCYFYSPLFPIFSHPRLFQLICYSVGCVGCPPSVDKANNSLPQPLPLTSQTEKAVTVIFHLLFISLAPFPMFSHRSVFQFNCYHVDHADRLPSVNKVNKSLPPSSPTCKLLEEGSDGKLSSCIYFFHTLPTFFSQYLFTVSYIVIQ